MVRNRFHGGCVGCRGEHDQAECQRLNEENAANLGEQHSPYVHCYMPMPDAEPVKVGICRRCGGEVRYSLVRLVACGPDRTLCDYCK